MVVAGFAIPSPGLSIASPGASYGQGRYRMLAHPAAPELLIVPSIDLKAPVIPIDADDWQAEYDQLRHEIAAYSTELAAKPHCVVFTKMDLLGDDEAPPVDAPEAFAVDAISAANRTGLDTLLAHWWSHLLDMKKVDVRRDDSIPLP